MSRPILFQALSALMLGTCLAVAYSHRGQTPADDASGLAKSSWPRFHRDLRNQGAGPKSQATGFPAWTFHTNSTNNAGGEVWSSPCIGEDGTVYVGSNDHNIYALNGNTGSMKWLVRTGGAIEFSSPAAAFDGTVVVGSSDHVVYCIIGSTGAVKWSFRTLGPVWSSPTISADGIVYIGSNDGNLYALELASGNKKWSFKTGGAVQSSCAFGKNDTLVFGSDDHKVYSIDRETGTKKWSFTTGKNVVASAAVGNSGTVIVGSLDHYLYALDGVTGKKHWSFNTGGAVTSAPAIAADGTVYVGCAVGNLGTVPPPRGVLYAIRGKNGQKRWAFPTGSEIWSSPALGGAGRLFFGSTRLGDQLSSKGVLYAVNAATGIPIWTADMGPGSVLCSPAVGEDGTIYIGSDAGNVIAFR